MGLSLNPAPQLGVGRFQTSWERDLHTCFLRTGSQNMSYISLCCFKSFSLLSCLYSTASVSTLGLCLSLLWGCGE